MTDPGKFVVYEKRRWLVLSLYSIRFTSPLETPVNPPSSRSGPGRAGDSPKKIRQAAERVSQSAREGGFTLDPGDWAKLAAEVAHVFTDVSGETAAAIAGKSLVVIPFAPPSAETPGGKFAHATFLSLYGRLSLDRRGEVAVVPPLRTEPVPAVLLARGRALNASFVLAASPVADNEAATLDVRLFSVADAAMTWSASFPIKAADASDVAARIAEAVLARVPRKEPRRPK